MSNSMTWAIEKIIRESDGLAHAIDLAEEALPIARAVDDLVKALEFYSQGNHFRISVMGDDVLQECGQIAEKALTQYRALVSKCE